MPVVPIIEKEGQNRALPAARLAQVNQDIPQLDTSNLFKAVENHIQMGIDNENQIRMVEAQKKLDEWEAVNLFDGRTGALAKKGKDTFGVPKALVSQFDKEFGDYSKSLDSDAQREMFAKLAASRRDTINKQLLSHERGQMEVYADEASGAAAETGINRASLYYNNEEIRESSIKAAKAAVLSRARIKGLPDEAVTNELLKVESKARLGALTRMADNDPKQAVEFYKANVAAMTAEDLLQAQGMMKPVERKMKAHAVASSALGSTMPMVDRDNIISFVMDELEGGDKVLKDGDGITKFGVNGPSNNLTDDATASLTREEAIMIKKAEYWDKGGIDSLPADMKLVAYDAYVQHGVDDTTTKMIEEADGDPRKLIEIRREYYKKLVKNNPKKNAPNFRGWMNRLAKLSAQVDAVRGDVPDEMAIYKKIDEASDDIDVANDAKKIVSDKIKMIEESKKRTWNAASEEAWSYVQSGKEVPASVEGRMNPKDVMEMRKGMEPDPVVYNQIRQLIVTGQPVDLNEHRWQLGNKFGDLLQLQQDPKKLVNARTVDDAIKGASGILLGKPSPKTAADFKKVEAFQRRVDTEIDTFQKTSGKTATADDVQKITDRLLLKIDTPGWGTAYAFEVGAEGGEIDGIPSDIQYFVRDKAVTYMAMVNSLIAQVEKRGLPVNNQNVLKMYKEKLSEKALSWKK